MKYRQSRNGAEEPEKDRRPREQSPRVAERKNDSKSIKGAESTSLNKRPLKSGKGDQMMESTSGTSTRILRSPKRYVGVLPVAYTVPIPMEIVEIIIDNVDGGAAFLACSLVCREWLARCRYYLFSRISTPAASCNSLLQVLDPAKLTALSGSRGKVPAIHASTLPPAGIFVQSLVITPSADYLLSSATVDPRHNPSSAAKLLIESTPNVKELQLTGVTEWALSHFLDPISRTKKLEDLALVDVRCSAWTDIATSLAHCAPNLKSLRISGLRFRFLQNAGGVAGDAQTTASIRPTLQQLYLPSLKILSIEIELKDSPFAGELLDNLAKGPSGTLERLEVLELPMRIVSHSQACLRRVKGSLRSLTVYCDEVMGPASVLEPRSYTLDLGALSRLRTLHFSIHAHWDYGRPALLAHRTLVNSLLSLPYSTLTCFRLTFRTAMGYAPYSDATWKELDDALSLPHLAELERVELFGMGSFIPSVKRGLTNSYARGMLHFL